MHLQPTIFALSLEDYMLPCLNKKLFGVDCPGCGMQRSADLLLHGEFLAAFQMYPAIYPIIMLLLFLSTTLFVKLKYAQQIKMVLMLLVAGTIIVSYILKMNNLFN
ncbi:DUF2752 domain-containing protein [Flagellimonas sediminis]|nr:DUF2752 domain-containing protein [Allomuricauda sediminis]